MTWAMPLVFMLLGIGMIILSIMACFNLATEFVVTAICYFVSSVLLIVFLIGVGAFWVNVTPSYPSFVNNTFSKAFKSYEEYRMHQAWTVLQSEVSRMKKKLN